MKQSEPFTGCVGQQVMAIMLSAYSTRVMVRRYCDGNFKDGGKRITTQTALQCIQFYFVGDF